MHPRDTAPGRYWDLGTHRLHAEFRPRPGTPTVVFESALGGSSVSWARVSPAVGAFAATFAYDRAGMGWSDPGPLPRDLAQQTRDLERLLELAQAPPPYILVGHSFGAMIVRLYAAHHPGDVAGMVLVDPPEIAAWASPDTANQAKLERGIRLARRGVLAARCGVATFGAWLVKLGAFRLASACATVVSGGRLRARHTFNFTPAAALPDECKPAMRWFWTRACFYQALASQMEATPAAARSVAALPGLGATPLAVLSATELPPSQLAEQHAMAALSSRSIWRQARASGHWIPLEEPELVISAVRDAVSFLVS